MSELRRVVMPNEPPAGTHVTYSRQYRRCHKLNCARCCPGKPGHGPYWFAYWREDRRVHSQYLGSSMPDVGGTTRAEAGSGAEAWCGAQAWLQVRSLGRFQVTYGAAPVSAIARDTGARRHSVSNLLQVASCL